MANFTSTFLDSGFASGVVGYLDHHPMRGDNRIVLTIGVEGILTQAIVDTGSPWCILNPKLAGLLDAAMKDIYAPTETLKAAWGPVTGRVIPVRVSLLADEGRGLDFETLALVPLIHEDDEWHQPNFIGVRNFLGHLRFAVDPSDQTFYFGLAQ